MCRAPGQSKCFFRRLETCLPLLAHTTCQVLSRHAHHACHWMSTFRATTYSTKLCDWIWLTRCSGKDGQQKSPISKPPKMQLGNQDKESCNDLESSCFAPQVISLFTTMYDDWSWHATIWGPDKKVFDKTFWPQKESGVAAHWMAYHHGEAMCLPATLLKGWKPSSASANLKWFTLQERSVHEHCSVCRTLDAHVNPEHYPLTANINVLGMTTGNAGNPECGLFTHFHLMITWNDKASQGIIEHISTYFSWCFNVLFPRVDLWVRHLLPPILGFFGTPHTTLFILLWPTQINRNGGIFAMATCHRTFHRATHWCFGLSVGLFRIFRITFFQFCLVTNFGWKARSPVHAVFWKLDVSRRFPRIMDFIWRKNEFLNL